MTGTRVVQDAEIRALLGDLAAGDAAGAQSARTLSEAARRVFPPELQDRWLAAARGLVQAGLGQAVTLAYLRHASAVAEAVDPEAALELAEAVKDLAFTAGAGRDAAQALPPAAARAALRLPDAAAYRAWIALVRRLAPEMPESVAPFLERTDRILAHLDLGKAEAWALGGLRASGGDRRRRRAFFAFLDPEAERALLRDAGEVVYADLDRRLRSYLTALWGIRPLVREAGMAAGGAPPRRTSFDGGIVHVPPSFAGVPAEQAERLYRASLAHVGAHLVYSGPRFRRGQLRPRQVALVSLIEDARVEALAMRDFPGLRRLWQPFHLAEPGGAATAPGLMARLARALIDPDYVDDDHFVAKGRRLFQEQADRLADPELSRGIGNILGNDLGQMRIQFNARTYVVEPPYRDDNTGLWEFPDEPPEDADAAEVLETVRIAPQPEDDATPRDDDPEDTPEEPANRARAAPSSPEEQGVPVARYPEWDYAVGQERDAWTTVIEVPAAPGPAVAIDRILERHGETVRRITALVRSARVSRPQRLRGQHEGEQLDVDACIQAVIARRLGDTPDPRVYTTTARRFRDLSVLVLLDVSQSTNDAVRRAGLSVLDLERAATALLAHAMDELGDPFALAAFCSNGREEVRYHRIKDFGQAYDGAARAGLAGLAGGLSTRMGAALRHAAADLRGQRTHRRLLLVITDGEPSDVDVPDRKYLVEDARKAVSGFRREGIDVFCVGLDSGGDSYLTRIFGRRNALQIDRLERLPEKLPLVYFRLTA